MNSLSWFLYLAEVIPNIGVFIFCVGVALTPAYVIWSAVVVDYTIWSGDSEDVKSSKVARSKTAWKKGPFAISITMVLISVLIPSKKTIYLIAGSEAGEYVVTSPEGAEIIADIKTIIKSQIEELK